MEDLGVDSVFRICIAYCVYVLRIAYRNCVLRIEIAYLGLSPCSVSVFRIRNPCLYPSNAEYGYATRILTPNAETTRNTDTE